MTVLLLDIDGVVNYPQQEINEDIKWLLQERNPYFVTGNSFGKSKEILGGLPFSFIFCNNSDEMRTDDGILIWRESKIDPLPNIQPFLCSQFVEINNNNIEWRNPRFVNFSMIGRYATKEERDSHDNSWRDVFIDRIKNKFDVEAVKGGQISVDIFSKGADKSRAIRWINEVMNKDVVFIGDKTDKGGNDYPIVEYCNNNPRNKWFKTSGVEETAEILREL